MPLGCMDYFELKALKNSRYKKDAQTSLFFPGAGDKAPTWRLSPLLQEERDILVTGDQEKSVQTDLVK